MYCTAVYKKNVKLSYIFFSVYNIGTLIFYIYSLDLLLRYKNNDIIINESKNLYKLNIQNRYCRHILWIYYVIHGLNQLSI